MSANFRLSERGTVRSLVATYAHGVTYDEMVTAARKNVELYTISRAHAVASPEYAARVAVTGRRWRLLAMSEDWCGDSVNTLPWIDAFAASSPGLEHRIIRRDEHLDLMDAHLTNGRTRSIPIVLLLDEQGIERAWWGPRPRGAQDWFEGAEAQALTKPDRYKVLRTQYARDRGRAILEELTLMIEAVAAYLPAGANAIASATEQAAS